MSYVCPVCLRESHHPMDERYGYCSACQGYTREPPPEGFRWVLFHGGHMDRCGRLLELARLEVGGTYERVTNNDVYVYDGEAFVERKLQLLAMLLGEADLRGRSAALLEAMQLDLAELDDDDDPPPWLVAMLGFDELEAAGITTAGELRAALRESLARFAEFDKP